MKTLEHKNIKTKKRNCFNALMLSCFHGRSGQSLIEIIIALAIGSIIIGSASTALVVILRSGTTAETQRSATALAQDYIEKTRAYARADWHNIYNLTKGSSTTYYFNASSTEIFTISGEEGVIANDIRGGLVGYWKFDEESGNTAYDSSGNNNDGTLQGGVVRATSTCKAGDCLSFDGTNDYVDVGTGTGLNITQNITMEAWIKLNTYTSGGASTDRASIVQKTGQYYMTVNSTNGTLDAFFQGVIGHTPSNSTVPLNQWTYTAITYDGSNIKWYINGVLDKMSSATGAITSDPRDVRVGGEPGFGRFTNGLIDEVRIYNRALSADDIDHLYNSSVFTRSFYIENVCRTNDANYDISGTAPCLSGSVNDPSTQKVNVTVGWEESGGASQFVLSDFITRWKNKVFPQSDWSGGVNPDVVITEPDNQFSSSTKIDISTPGSFRIEGL